jgi:LPXTG-motif cell wall-anchored protein
MDLVKIKEDELGDLKERANEFLKWERATNFSGVLAIFLTFLPIAIASLLISRPLTGEETILLLSFGLIVGLASLLVLSRKKKEFKVKDVEWLRLYSYGIYNSLADYFNTESLGLKKKGKQKAIGYGESLMYAVAQRWEIGSFSLVEGCQKAVKDFKDNLRLRVMPALEGNDDDKLRKVRDLMYNFFYQSNKLKPEDLQEANAEMSTEGGPRFLESKKQGIISYHGILGIIEDKRIRPYVTPLAISTIVAGIVLLVLAYEFGLNLTVVSITIILFCGLLAFLRPTKRGQVD